MHHQHAERNQQAIEASLDSYVDQLDRRQHQLDQLQSKQRDVSEFDHTNGWRSPRIDELDQQLDRHWTDVVVAAARAGHPDAYGRQRLEHTYRTLLAQSRPAPGEQVLLRKLGDLEQAAVTSTRGWNNEAEAIVDRASRVRQPHEWPELSGYRHLERDHGRAVGIEL